MRGSGEGGNQRPSSARQEVSANRTVSITIMALFASAALQAQALRILSLSPLGEVAQCGRPALQFTAKISLIRNSIGHK